MTIEKKIAETQAEGARPPWTKPVVRKMRAGDAENFTRTVRSDGALTRS